MASENGTSQNSEQGKGVARTQENHGSDFYPRRAQPSRDDVPSTNVPLPQNSVVEKIMIGGTTSEGSARDTQTGTQSTRDPN